jgi:ribosome recycling factor
MANETLFRHGFSRKAMVQELNRELQKRRQVYRNVPGFPEQFVLLSEQRQYDTLKQLRDFLDDMTDETFRRLDDANKAKKAAIQNQLL